MGFFFWIKSRRNLFRSEKENVELFFTFKGKLDDLRNLSMPNVHRWKWHDFNFLLFHLFLSKLTKTFPITFSQTFKQIDFNILLNLNSLFTQILFNYISCYYANNVTNNALSTAEIAYNIHWYKLPWRKQHFVKLMIARAQKPFFLKGYDIVDCSLSTFLNVNLIRCAHARTLALSLSLLLSNDGFCFRLFCSSSRRRFHFIWSSNGWEIEWIRRKWFLVSVEMRANANTCASSAS